MPTSQSSSFVTGWTERFRKDSLASGVVAGLRDRGEEIWEAALNLLQQESPEYRNSVDSELTKRSKNHCNKILQTIMAIAADRITKGVDPFDFVRKHAQWRVRHQVPLMRQQRAYRVAHRIYRETTQESLLRHAEQDEAIISLTMLSNFWIEFFDHLAAVLAEAHGAEEGLITARCSRNFVELMDDLLRGREPMGAEANRLLALCGIQLGAPMAVAVAKPHWPENGNRIDLEVTQRSFVRLFEQILPSTSFGRLIDIRNGQVTAIASSDRDAARSLLRALRGSGFAARAGNGHSARVGVSLDVVDIARLPQALEEAQVALEFASDAQPLLHFSDIDLPELLVRRANHAAVRLIPEWARHFNSAEDDQSREMTRTIRVFADCSFNVKQTAQRLGLHTNTVYFRLNRIRKLTGVDPRTYSGTSLVLTVLRLLEVHGGAKE
jgi:PucR C-terminal helix-turn-helix domain/GGDEF-like domain